MWFYLNEWFDYKMSSFIYGNVENKIVKNIISMILLYIVSLRTTHMVRVIKIKTQSKIQSSVNNKPRYAYQYNDGQQRSVVVPK